MGAKDSKPSYLTYDEAVKRGRFYLWFIQGRTRDSMLIGVMFMTDVMAR